MMEDTRGELANQLNIWDEEEGLCIRSILIVDDKSVIRHLASSSLPMDDLIDSVSLTLDLLRDAGPVVLGEQGRKSSFLDKLWRTSLKLPATPHTSLKRSASRAGSEEQFPGQVVENQPQASCNTAHLSEEECQQRGTERRRGGGGGRGCQKERQKQEQEQEQKRASAADSDQPWGGTFQPGGG